MHQQIPSVFKPQQEMPVFRGNRAFSRQDLAPSCDQGTLARKLHFYCALKVSNGRTCEWDA